MSSLLEQAGLAGPQGPLETLTIEDCADLIGQVLNAHSRHPALRARYGRRPRFELCNQPFLLLLGYGTSARHCGPSEWLKEQIHTRLRELQRTKRLGLTCYTAIYENTALPRELYGWLAAKQAQGDPMLPHLVLVDHELSIHHVPRPAIVSAGFDEVLAQLIAGLAKAYTDYLRERGVVAGPAATLGIAEGIAAAKAIVLDSPTAGNPKTVLDQVMADEYGHFSMRLPGRNTWFRTFINAQRSYLTGLVDDREEGRAIRAIATIAYDPAGRPRLAWNDRPTFYYAELLGRFIGEAAEAGVPKADFRSLAKGDQAATAFRDLRAVLGAISGLQVPLPGELPPDGETYFQGDSAEDRTGYWADTIAPAALRPA